MLDYVPGLGWWVSRVWLCHEGVTRRLRETDTQADLVLRDDLGGNTGLLRER